MEEVVETPETGNEEGNDGEEVTPVTKPETPPAEAPEGTPEETPAETPEETPDEVIEETPEESAEVSEEVITGSDANVMTVDPMAAVVSEQATVEVTETNKEESDKTDPAKNVKVISYLGGCVSGDKVVENEDLKFLVRVTAGRKLTKVAYKIGDGAEQTLTVPATANAGNDYSFTIAKTAIFSTGADGKTVGKPVAITLETAPISYTVKLANDDDSEKSNYALYAVTGDGDGKLAAAAYDGTGKAAYGESMRFALVPNEGKNLKPASIKVGEESIEFTKKELAQEAAAPAPGPSTQADEKKTAYVFTVDTSKAAYSLAQNADDELTVTVAARALSELTVTMTAADNAEYSYAASAANTAAASFINYVDGTGFAKVAEESADLSKSLAFQVKPAAGLIVDEVTAKVGAKDVTVAVADVTGKDEKECTVALNQEALDLSEGSVNLVVDVKTALKEGADGVTKITFAGAAATDLAHAKYTAADESENLVYDEENVKDTYLVDRTAVSNAYYIQVEPKAGYELTKSSETDKGADNELIGKDKQIVTVTETRKVDGETEPATVTYVAEAYADDAAVPILLTLHKDAVVDPAAKAYDVTAVTVTVGTVLAENPDEKKVTFSGDLLDSVTVKNTVGVVLIDDETDGRKIYAIAEGTNSLEFSVAATAEPVVEVNSTPVKGTAADGSYNYSIPTMSMGDDAQITVTAQGAERKAVKVNLAMYALSDEEGDCQVTVDGEAGDLTSDSDENATENDYFLVDEDGLNPVVGSKVSMKLTAAEGYTFEAVTYTVKGGEAQKGTVSADKTTATVDFTVTDEVQVAVETESHWYVKLDGVGVTGEDGAYKADCNVENITAELYCGMQRKTLMDVIVMDGESTAATKAVIESEGSVAKIAKIDANEYGKTLTVRLSNDGDYYDATLEVGGASTGVTVKMDGKAVSTETGITMPTDAQVSLEVSATGEKANVNDLKAEIVFEKKGEAAVTGTVAGFFAAGASVDTATGAVTIAEDGKVDLRSAAAKEAPKDNVFLVISSTVVKEENKDKVFAKIPLNITGPIVLSDAVKEVTAAAASSSNREVRLNLGLEFTDKKNPPKAPLAGDLYYKVELTKVEGDAKIQEAVTAGKLVLSDAADRVKFIKIESYAAADLAKFVEFNLVKSYKDAEGEETDGDLPGIITTEAKVTLVQSLASAELTSTSAAADYVANDAKTKEVKEGLVTKEPIYETKLSVKTLNGATVFTGQQNVTVAKPNFSKGTTCDEITVQFVNSKTGRILGSGKGSKTSTASYDSYFTAGVNEDNSIWVSHSNQSSCAKNIKDLGVKVTAHAENDEYRASAVVKLKIQQGIYSIDTDESKAALPTTLYRDAKGAVKSVKITTVLNGGNANKDYKPAKANLTWEITDSDGNPVSDPSCDLSENIKKALTKTNNKGKLTPDISVKNGTVSVAKTYQYDAKNPAANTFWVNAKAADFVGNNTELNEDTTGPVRFEISAEQQVIGSLAVVDYSGTPLGEVSSDKNGAVVTLKAETMLEEYPMLVALKPGAKLDQYGQYNVENDALPATFSISGKMVTLDKEYTASTPELVFNKPGDKITVTAKVVDGSKAKDVKMTLNVKPFEQLGLRLTAANGADYEPDRTEAITYSGSSNEKYALELEYYSEAQESWQPLPQYKSVKVEVKDGKLVANKDWAKDTDEHWIGNAVVVAAGKDQSVITLKDTGAKNAVKNTYTVKADVNTKNLKAAKIKMKSPTKMVYGYNGAILWQTNDQDKKTKEYIYAGKYVKLAPDFTVAELTSTDKKWQAGERDAYQMLDPDGEYFRIDENGRFVTWLSSAGSDSDRYLAAGSYKMIATVGDIVDGVFVPVTKDTKLSFNVPKYKASNTSLSVTAGYKLDVKSSAKATIAVKSNYSYKVFDAKNEIKKNDQKLGDHSNHFTDFFEVKRSGWRYDYQSGGYTWRELSENDWIDPNNNDAATIGLKDNLTVEQINYITGKSSDKDQVKAAKADCVGYITVDNGCYRKDVKITISFNELKKYTAKANPLFENSAAIKHNVTVYNGKNRVSVLYAAIDETGKNDLTGLTAVEKDGAVELTTAATGIAAGKYTVTLKVVPASAAVMKADAQAAGALDKTAMLKDYAIPAELKLEVKELAKAQKTLKTNTAVKLTSSVYDAEVEDGYLVGAAGKYGSYNESVPYSLTASNISIKSVEVMFAGNTVEGTDKKLVEAVLNTPKISSVYDYGKTTAIKLTVNREALEKAVDGKGKHLYYGKTLKVPVKINYVNTANAPAEETVTYSITVPKRPAETYDKEALKAKAAKIFVTIDEEHPEYTISELQWRLSQIVASLIPADTDYVIQELAVTKEATETPAPAALEEGDDPAVDPTEAANLEIVKTGKAVVSFKIKNNAKSAEAAEPFTFTYDLGIKPGTVGEEIVTLTALRTEIQNALNDSTKVAYAKDKDAAAVMADLSKDGTLVKKVLDDAKLGRKNYSIKASVKHNPATKSSKANMEVTVEIRNLTNSELISGKWKRLLTVTKTIVNGSGTNLNDFDQAYTAVKTFFETAGKIAGIVDDCSGQEDDIWKAIEDAAKEQVNNPDITVTVENKDYIAPSVVTVDSSTTNKPGHIQFTVKLSENGRVRNWKSTKVEIDADKVTQYAMIATVETDVKKAFLTTTTENDKLKEIARGSGTPLNDSDILKAAIVTALDAVVTKKPAEAGISVAEDTGAKYLGYLYEIKDWTFTAATKKADASLRFNLVLTSKGNAATTATIAVACTDLITKDDAYQTLQELADEIAAVEEVTVVIAPTAENYATTLTTELGKLDNATSKRTIELITTGEGVTVTFTAATDTAPAKVAGVKATITQGSGENAPTKTVDLKTITFKVASETPDA